MVVDALNRDIFRVSFSFQLLITITRKVRQTLDDTHKIRTLDEWKFKFWNLRNRWEIFSSLKICSTIFFFFFLLFYWTLNVRVKIQKNSSQTFIFQQNAFDTWRLYFWYMASNIDVLVYGSIFEKYARFHDDKMPRTSRNFENNDDTNIRDIVTLVDNDGHHGHVIH